jgi:tRNA threonylcarbamoyladenosine biosynthesis protein TsaE
MNRRGSLVRRVGPAAPLASLDVAPGNDRGVRLSATALRDTRSIAAALAASSRVGDVLLLQGEMGTGKTAFVQGFAESLGVDEPVTSPTFNLVHTYDTGRIVIHHADLYRLERYGEIEDLALSELLESGVLLVEWGGVASAEFPDRLDVELAMDPTGEDARAIVVHPSGRRWAPRWAALLAALAPWREAPC